MKIIYEKFEGDKYLEIRLSKLELDKISQDYELISKEWMIGSYPTTISVMRLLPKEELEDEDAPSKRQSRQDP